MKSKKMKKDPGTGRRTNQNKRGDGKAGRYDTQHSPRVRGAHNTQERYYTTQFGTAKNVKKIHGYMNIGLEGERGSQFFNTQKYPGDNPFNSSLDLKRKKQVR